MAYEFPLQTTITNPTAIVYAIIIKDGTQIESGLVAAFYNDDIRTPGGGNGFTQFPIPGQQHYYATLNIGFQVSEASELQFTMKYMDINTGEIFECTPNINIAAFRKRPISGRI